MSSVDFVIVFILVYWFKVLFLVNYFFTLPMDTIVFVDCVVYLTYHKNVQALHMFQFRSTCPNNSINFFSAFFLPLLKVDLSVMIELNKQLIPKTNDRTQQNHNKTNTMSLAVLTQYLVMITKYMYSQ